MAGGKTHFAAEFLVGAALAGGAWFASQNEALPSFFTPLRLGTFGAGYLVSMLFLSPDLDLERNETLNRWGPLRIVWGPYHTVFRHRGLSHHPLVGTATRILYLLLVALVFWAGVTYVASAAGADRPPAFRPAEAWDFMANHFELLAWFIVGCYVPNLIHVGIDRL